MKTMKSKNKIFNQCLKKKLKKSNQNRWVQRKNINYKNIATHTHTNTKRKVPWFLVKIITYFAVVLVVVFGSRQEPKF